MIDAKDAVTALIYDSKISNKLNSSIVKSLFDNDLRLEPSINKRI